MIIELIASVFGAIKEFLGLQNKKIDLNNTPEMKKAAEAQKEVDAQSKTETAVAKGDVDEIRKELAE